MRRLLVSFSLVAMLLAGSAIPSLAHGRRGHHAHRPTHGMCARGVSGACHPSLPGRRDGGNSGPWRCHPQMDASASELARSHARLCA